MAQRIFVAIALSALFGFSCGRPTTDAESANSGSSKAEPIIAFPAGNKAEPSGLSAKHSQLYEWLRRNSVNTFNNNHKKVFHPYPEYKPVIVPEPEYKQIVEPEPESEVKPEPVYKPKPEILPVPEIRNHVVTHTRTQTHVLPSLPYLPYPIPPYNRFKPYLPPSPPFFPPTLPHFPFPRFPVYPPKPLYKPPFFGGAGGYPFFPYPGKFVPGIYGPIAKPFPTGFGPIQLSQQQQRQPQQQQQQPQQQQQQPQQQQQQQQLPYIPFNGRVFGKPVANTLGNSFVRIYDILKGNAQLPFPSKSYPFAPYRPSYRIPPVIVN